MARKTKEEALETRNRLLDTAELVFNERGVSRTSLAEIAAAAGVTRGAIYWHFKNKLDLFSAMMDRVTLPMEDAFGADTTPEQADPIAEIRQRGQFMLERIQSNAQAQRVFEIVSHKCEYVDDMAPLRERNLDCRSDCITQMSQGFREAVRRGMINKSVNPRLAAVGLHAMMDGLIVNWLLQPAEFSLRTQGSEMLDTYLRGLGATIPTSEGKATKTPRVSASTPATAAVPKRARKPQAAASARPQRTSNKRSTAPEAKGARR